MPIIFREKIQEYFLKISVRDVILCALHNSRVLKD